MHRYQKHKAWIYGILWNAFPATVIKRKAVILHACARVAFWCANPEKGIRSSHYSTISQKAGRVRFSNSQISLFLFKVSQSWHCHKDERIQRFPKAEPQPGQSDSEANASAACHHKRRKLYTHPRESEVSFSTSRIFNVSDLNVHCMWVSSAPCFSKLLRSKKGLMQLSEYALPFATYFAEFLGLELLGIRIHQCRAETMELAATQFQLSHLFGQICFLIRYLSGCFHCFAAHRSSGAYLQLQVDFMGKRTTKIWFPWGDTEFVGSWAWRASGIAQGFPEMLEIPRRSTGNLKDNLFAELAWILTTPKQFGSKFLASKRPFTLFSCPLKKKLAMSPLNLRFATIAAMSATSAVSGSPLTVRQPTRTQAKVVFWRRGRLCSFAMNVCFLGGTADTPFLRDVAEGHSSKNSFSSLKQRVASLNGFCGVFLDATRNFSYLFFGAPG